ncbi:hypothetical protein [Minwuia thermotolerans]|nr:hypothetical protein [Minwuia thermotolerans]
MTRTMNYRLAVIGTAALAAGAVLLAMPLAQAQNIENNWTPTPKNRTSVAAMIKQAEEGVFEEQANPTRVTTGSGQGVVLCGGGGEDKTAATSNLSCVVVGEGANASINLGQESDGDQTADTDENAETDNVIDDVGQLLNSQN